MGFSFLLLGKINKASHFLPHSTTKSFQHAYKMKKGPHFCEAPLNLPLKKSYKCPLYFLATKMSTTLMTTSNVMTINIIDVCLDC